MGFRVLAVLVIATLGKTSNGGDPLGHMKPFGSHTQSQPLHQVEEFPTPLGFFETYVKASKPVLFKSVLNGSYPFYTRWKDEYLEKTYGDKLIEIEMGKKETRDGSMDFQSLKHFLKIYKKKDVYMVQDIFPEMMDEVMVPRCLHCGGFQKLIDKGVIWFSSGGTKSVLHNDNYDNINCLLDGTKDLVMVDKLHTNDVTAGGFDERGFVPIDVDSVDLHKFPKLQQIPISKVKMEPGDCLYIPMDWWHQVNSFGNRNIALNFWFSHLVWFNTTECDKWGPLNPVEPLSKFGFVTGVDKGRAEMLGILNELPCSKETFINSLTKGEASKRQEVFRFLDKDENSVLSSEELYSFNVEKFVKRFLNNLSENFLSFFDGEEENEGALYKEQVVKQRKLEADFTSETKLGDEGVDKEKLSDQSARDEF